jgi:hypothetical protein
MAARGKNAPAFKFRLWCRACNSYTKTSIEQTRPLVERPGALSGLVFRCECGNEATDLDERADGQKGTAESETDERTRL